MRWGRERDFKENNKIKVSDISKEKQSYKTSYPDTRIGGHQDINLGHWFSPPNPQHNRLPWYCHSHPSHFSSYGFGCLADKHHLDLCMLHKRNAPQIPTATLKPISYPDTCYSLAFSLQFGVGLKSMTLQRLPKIFVIFYSFHNF